MVVKFDLDRFQQQDNESYNKNDPKNGKNDTDQVILSTDDESVFEFSFIAKENERSPKS